MPLLSRHAYLHLLLKRIPVAAWTWLFFATRCEDGAIGADGPGSSKNAPKIGILLIGRYKQGKFATNIFSNIRLLR